MGARRRPTEAIRLDGDVMPADLLDHASAVWRDSRLFLAWLQRYTPADAMPTGRHLEYLLTAGWNYKLDFASRAWALANGLVLAAHPKFPDFDRLTALGYTPVSASERGAQMHGTDLPMKRLADSSRTFERQAG
jgi:hypothetical protein